MMATPTQYLNTPLTDCLVDPLLRYPYITFLIRPVHKSVETKLKCGSSKGRSILFSMQSSNTLSRSTSNRSIVVRIRRVLARLRNRLKNVIPEGIRNITYITSIDLCSHTPGEEHAGVKRT